MNCANHTDRERVAFCQNCGKPLCQECMRAVGSAVFCEPCLAAKLAAAGAIPVGGYSYSDPASGVNASGTAAGGTYAYSDPLSGAYAAGVIPPQPISGAPNPMLAGLLGFIPGVGAMYNEQYAKGIVHLIVFAVLVSLKDNHGIFSLFVAGWIFYMVIEAHHTARARRDGLPLPNPFGLNDLGERLGFGKSWGAPAQVPNVDPAAIPGVPPAATYTPGPAYVPPAGNPYVAGAVPPNWTSSAWTPPPTPGWEPYAPVPPIPPPVPLDTQVPYPGNRFPAGALWLIGFGALFLLGNAGLFHGFSTRLFLPFLLIGLAVFIFVRKMTCTGGGLTSDGTASYRLRVFRALRGAVWVALVGFLFLLNDFDILSWGHSWPLFIILAGVMTVLERAAYSAAVAAGPMPIDPNYPTGYPNYPPAPVPPAPPSSSVSIVPANEDSHGSHESATDRKEGE